MAGGRPAAGCCCFVNNVRFPVLFVLTISIAAMFSSIIVLNLTSILEEDFDWRPVPSLDSLHGSTYKGYGKMKRDINQPKIPSKVVRFDESSENEDDGHPILPPTEKPVITTTAKISTTRKTEKPVPIFITNSPETTTERTERATTQKIKITTTPDDVVAREVEKSLKKLRDAEEGKLEDVSKTAQNSAEDFKKPSETISLRARRGLLYAAPGFGILVGVFLSNYVAKRWGVRKFFSTCLAEASIFIVLMVSAQKTNYVFLLIVRFVQGIIFSGVFPVMGTVLVQWGPLKEQLVFLTVMFMFISIGPIATWPLFSYIHSIEQSLDLVQYIQAIFIAILGGIWWIFYRDRPQMHPWVSGVELNKIVAGKVQELQSNRAHSDSFAPLLRSLSAWSIWTSAFGFFSVTAFFTTYIPAFLSSHEVFMVEMLGVHGIVPFLLLPISCGMFAFINLLFKPSTKIIRILNTVSFVIAAILIVSIPFVAFLQTKTGLMSILLISLMPFGLSIVCGFVRSLTVVGRVFAEQIVTLCAIPFGLAYVLIPAVVTYQVIENKLGEWSGVSLFLCFILFAVAVEFAVFGRGRSPSWAGSSWDPLVASTKMQSLALIDFNHDECGLYELRRIEPKNNR